jgi:hypothetical protein
MKIKDLKLIDTLEDFETIGLTSPVVDISYRGGTLGFHGGDVSSLLDIDKNLLPSNIGAFCNYLGGGLRGSIQVSNYSDKITGRKKVLLDAFLQACLRVYHNTEGTLNDSEYPDGDINWEAQGTAACRRAGVKSAY